MCRKVGIFQERGGGRRRRNFHAAARVCGNTCKIPYSGKIRLWYKENMHVFTCELGRTDGRVIERLHNDGIASDTDTCE